MVALHATDVGGIDDGVTGVVLDVAGEHHEVGASTFGEDAEAPLGLAGGAGAGGVHGEGLHRGEGLVVGEPAAVDGGVDGGEHVGVLDGSVGRARQRHAGVEELTVGVGAGEPFGAESLGEPVRLAAEADRLHHAGDAVVGERLHRGAVEDRCVLHPVAVGARVLAQEAVEEVGGIVVGPVADGVDAHL